MQAVIPVMFTTPRNTDQLPEGSAAFIQLALRGSWSKQSKYSVSPVLKGTRNGRNGWGLLFFVNFQRRLAYCIALAPHVH